MIKIISGLLLGMGLLAALAAPALSFDPPEQGTDNATDVVLWYGDNLTIASANVTVNELDLTVDGEVTVTGLTDSIDEAAGNIFAFIVVAFVLSWAFIRGGAVLQAIGTVVAFVYGFRLASEYEVYTSLWVAGVAIGLIGLYFLYSLVPEDIWGKMRGIARRKQ